MAIVETVIGNGKWETQGREKGVCSKPEVRAIRGDHNELWPRRLTGCRMYVVKKLGSGWTKEVVIIEC